MKSLVSVVIPGRDGCSYLAQAVASILSQTVENIELVLVDDHSTDTSISSLDYDPRLRIIKSNGTGVVNAFNTGFASSRGSFIARMDAFVHDEIAAARELFAANVTLQRRRHTILHSTPSEHV